MVAVADRSINDELADELTEYRGQWVALKNGHVVAAAASPSDVVRTVREMDLEGVSLHKVPDDSEGSYLL